MGKTDHIRTDLENKNEEIQTFADADLVINSSACGHLDSLIRMYASGVDLSASDYDKRSTLHLAASNGHLDIVKYLIANGRDPVAMKKATDRFGNTPFDDAVREGHNDVKDFLSL